MITTLPVIKVYGPKITGAGVIVTPDGKAITCAHVVTKKSVGWCIFVYCDGHPEVTRSQVVAVDWERDLALLQLFPSNGSSLSFANETPLPNSPIKVFGFHNTNRQRWGLMASLGKVAKITSKKIITTAPVKVGYSGGPVLNENDHILGIVQSRGRSILLQPRSYAIPAKVCQEFLKGIA